MDLLFPSIHIVNWGLHEKAKWFVDIMLVTVGEVVYIFPKITITIHHLAKTVKKLIILCKTFKSDNTLFNTRYSIKLNKREYVTLRSSIGKQPSPRIYDHILHKVRILYVVVVVFELFDNGVKYETAVCLNFKFFEFSSLCFSCVKFSQRNNFTHGLLTCKIFPNGKFYTWFAHM